MEARYLNAGGTGRIDWETETFISVAHALRADGHDASEDGTVRGTPLVPTYSVCMGSDPIHGCEVAMPSTSRNGDPGVIAFQTRIGRNGRGQPKDHIDAMTSCAGGTHADSKPHVAYYGGVRRITPLEAERLQGFGDGYTAIKYRGKPAADAPRYKALGNSMAVPCMAWIGNRIATTARKEPPQ